LPAVSSDLKYQIATWGGVASFFRSDAAAKAPKLADSSFHGRWRLQGICCWLLLLVPMILLCSPPAISGAAAQRRQARRVLLINDLGIVSSPGFAEIDQAIFSALQNSPYQIEFYHESLQL